MLTNLRIFLVGILLMGSVLSCTDHRLGGPSSPVRLRLKTVENVGGVIFSLAYNQNNQLISYTGSGRGNYLVYYDAQNRYAKIDLLPNPADASRGARYRFRYFGNGNSYVIYTSTFNDTHNVEIDSLTYTLDANRHITNYNDTDNVFEQNQYTGENITTSNYQQGSYIVVSKREYDDKLNPLYGLPLGGRIQQFSRNNLTKVTSEQGGTKNVIERVYEYNEQGLPTRGINTNGFEEARYTYESY